MQYSERTSSRTICFQQRTSRMCKEASNFVPWSNEKLQGMHCIISRTTSNYSFIPPPLLCSRDYIVYCTASNCFPLPFIALLTFIFASKECHINFTNSRNIALKMLKKRSMIATTTQALSKSTRETHSQRTRAIFFEADFRHFLC